MYNDTISLFITEGRKYLLRQKNQRIRRKPTMVQTPVLRLFWYCIWHSQELILVKKVAIDPFQQEIQCFKDIVQRKLQKVWGIISIIKCFAFCILTLKPHVIFDYQKKDLRQNYVVKIQLKQKDGIKDKELILYVERFHLFQVLRFEEQKHSHDKTMLILGTYCASLLCWGKWAFRFPQLSTFMVGLCEMLAIINYFTVGGSILLV